MKKSLRATLKRKLLPLLAVLLFFELLLWVLRYPPYWTELSQPDNRVFAQGDSVRGWRQKEGNFMLTDTKRTIRAAYDSEGRRAVRDGEAQKLASVLLFGDSFVQGFGLNDEQTFAWLLSERFPQCVVMNYGTGGYGTTQVLLTAREALLKVHQAPVLMVYMFNNFHEARTVGAPDWQRVVRAPPRGFFFPYSALGPKGELKILSSPGQGVWPLSLRLRLSALIEDAFENLAALPRLLNRRHTTERVLEELKLTAAGGNADLLIALYDLSSREREDYEHFLTGSGIQWRDCSFPGYDTPQYRQPDWHPDQAANERIAACIGDWVKERLDKLGPEAR